MIRPHPLSHLFLTLTHGQELDLVGSKINSLGKFHEIARRVRTGAQNKDDRRHRRTLLVDGIEAYDWWGHVFLAHDLRDVLGDGAVDSVDTETA